MPKSFDEVKAILSNAKRGELRDHAFGDREIFWTIDGEEIGWGYSGSTVSAGLSAEGEASFSGDQARELIRCGSSCVVERNDETGPDTYRDGACMPGLTLEGVRKELCES